jgi:PEP-CTERM motif
MSRLSCTSIILAVLLFAATVPANAGLMTYDVKFSANTFQVGSGANPAPVDPVTGEFTITMDPTVDVVNDTADISLKSLNIVLDSPLAFTYNPAAESPFPAGTLRVGGLADGADGVQFNPSTNDFWLQIASFATAPAFTQVGYSQTAVSNNNLFYTINETGSVDVTPLATPEPTSLCLAGMGLASLGLVRLRRKTKSL